MLCAEIAPVLAAYPADCQPRKAEPLESGGGFSGARLWRLHTGRGELCLRRWPSEHPTVERLEFIQAVLRHVRRAGFQLVPVPLPTVRGRGYVRHAGHLWELAPWMPGAADYHLRPDPAKLQGALAALAEFHRAAAGFPLKESGPKASPGMVERLQLLDGLAAGGLAQLSSAVASQPCLELDDLAHRWLALAGPRLSGARLILAHAAAAKVPMQPCLRDVWSDHVLFVGEQVSGLIDFGAMRVESVAADIARLVGSLARNNEADWSAGLFAYEAIRPLSAEERSLVSAFDRANVLLAGANWLHWIYVEGRQFADLTAVRGRLAESLSRLEACG